MRRLVPQPAVSNRSKQPLYSITSSARMSSIAGTSRPSAFAVFRLMTNSKFRRLLDRQIGWLLALENTARHSAPRGERHPRSWRRSSSGRHQKRIRALGRSPAAYSVPSAPPAGPGCCRTAHSHRQPARPPDVRQKSRRQSRSRGRCEPPRQRPAARVSLPPPACRAASLGSL